MVKQTVSHSCHRILLSNKKEQTIDTHNLDETPENYVSEQYSPNGLHTVGLHYMTFPKVHGCRNGCPGLRRWLQWGVRVWGCGSVCGFKKQQERYLWWWNYSESWLYQYQQPDYVTVPLSYKMLTLGKLLKGYMMSLCIISRSCI